MREGRGSLVIFQNLTPIRRLEVVRRDFVSNISHELRTPLASLKAVVETLRDGAIDDADNKHRFIDIAMKQIKANEFYVVSHAYNIVHIDEDHAQLNKAFETYVPRYEGDVQYDIRTNIVPRLEQQLNHKLRTSQ